MQSAEAAGGRLGAVLSAPRTSDPVLLGRAGPWLVTTPASARRVLTDVADFDFPGHVARGTDLSGSTGDTRSGHHVFAATTPADVTRGMAVFVSEWQAAVGRPPNDATQDRAFDAMQVLRRPVARATCAAVLPDVPEDERDRVAALVLRWIDVLGPVISAARPPRRWSRARRRELRASRVLEDALASAGSSAGSPQQLATMLAAGIQVPVAAGAWLLVWLASHPQRVHDPDHVVWETLRLTPPTWITPRVAVRDVRLGAVDLPAGALVMVSPLLLGRLPELVPGSDADRASFDPARWATDQARPGAWLPFGAGPHACPGRTLGLAMLRHLATWAGRQRLTTTHRVSVDQARGIAPAPALVTLGPAEVEL